MGCGREAVLGWKAYRTRTPAVGASEGGRGADDIEFCLGVVYVWAPLAIWDVMGGMWA